LIGPVVVTVTADAWSRDDTPHTSVPIDTHTWRQEMCSRDVRTADSSACERWSAEFFMDL